jgi:hypothetical protein
MKDFIEYLLKQIVSKPEEMKVEESIDPENNFHSYRVTVAPDDMGFVIGKEGRTIKSLRNLTRAKAIKDGIRMNLELIDVEGPKPSEE